MRRSGVRLRPAPSGQRALRSGKLLRGAKGEADVLRAEDVGAVARVEVQPESSLRRAHEVRGVDELRHPAAVTGRGDERTHELEAFAVLGAQQIDRGLRAAARTVDAVLYAGVAVCEAVDFKAPRTQVEKRAVGIGTDERFAALDESAVGAVAPRRAYEGRLAEPAVRHKGKSCGVVKRVSAAVEDDVRIGERMSAPASLLVRSVVSQHGKRLRKIDQVAALHGIYPGLPVRAEQGKPPRNERLYFFVIKNVLPFRLQHARAHSARHDFPAFPEIYPVCGIVQKNALQRVGEHLPSAVGSEVGSEYERVRRHGGKTVPTEHGIAGVQAEIRIFQHFKRQIVHINTEFCKIRLSASELHRSMLPCKNGTVRGAGHLDTR